MMLIPSTNLIARQTDHNRACAWCKRLTVWTFRRGEREVAACRPDHAEKALARPEGRGAIPEDLAIPSGQTSGNGGLPVNEFGGRSG